MPDDLPVFLLSIGLFGLYLFASARTEMFTRWQRDRPPSPPKPEEKSGSS
jgi:hypothetical protein